MELILTIINFDNNKFPITEFSREEAIEFRELMKQTFIEHWESKQNKAKPEDYMRSNK